MLPQRGSVRLEKPGRCYGDGGAGKKGPPSMVELVEGRRHSRRRGPVLAHGLAASSMTLHLPNSRPGWIGCPSPLMPQRVRPWGGFHTPCPLVPGCEPQCSSSGPTWSPVPTWCSGGVRLAVSLEAQKPPPLPVADREETVARGAVGGWTQCACSSAALGATVRTLLEGRLTQPRSLCIWDLPSTFHLPNPIPCSHREAGTQEM